MIKHQSVPMRNGNGNRLLARLPKQEYERVLSDLKPVTLKLRQVIYDVRAPIDYAYFPVRGVISAMTVMVDGSAIEVATVGNEGMMGLPAIIAANSSPNQVIVQVAGDALRIKASKVQEEVDRKGTLSRLLVLYQSVFLTQVSQSVACNGLHPVLKRCCRWLLITHDRMESDELPLTHEFLGIMLGVRRSSVTEVLQPLQEQGLIRYGRGIITVIDRKGLEAACCECYQTVMDEFRRLLG